MSSDTHDTHPQTDADIANDAPVDQDHQPAELGNEELDDVSGGWAEKTDG